MLSPAILYKEELQTKARIKILHPEPYKFYQLSNYLCYEEFTINNTDEWQDIKRVSLNKDGKVLGYLSAHVCRSTNDVDSLCAINFDLSTLSITFIRDMEHFLQYLLTNFRKVAFSVVVGNPAERLYDKVIEKYNGRIVGIKQEEVKLIDNKFYDVKMYEILRKENAIL